MDKLTLEKISSLQGSVQMVGSKSLTNRALLLSALGTGRCRLYNVLHSDDSAVMLQALRDLGVKVELGYDTTAAGEKREYIAVEGVGGSFVSPKPEVELPLFLGNAGTAMRPLAAALAFSEGTFVLTGEPRMYERPVGELVDALRSLGAHIEYVGKEGYPPLRIIGQKKSLEEAESEFSVDVAGNVSSQFITALLLSSRLLPRSLTIKVKGGELISKPYVKLTIGLLTIFGVEVETEDFTSFTVRPGSIVSPESYHIEGDATGASYFAAGAAIKGSVTIDGIGSQSLQGDIRFLSVLEKMGAKITWLEDGHSVRVEAAEELSGIDIDMNDMPDAAMTLVPLALFTKKREPIVLRNIASWRVKECDRIAAMATEMRRVGCDVVEKEDEIMVTRTEKSDELKASGAVPEFATYNDHRMAMALSLCALDRTIVIQDPSCCRKTFPEYFTVLESVQKRS